MSRSRLARWRVPMGFAAAVVYVLVARPTWLSLAVGIPVAAAGLAVRAAAAGHIRKNDQLARSGPYRYTRNPLYLGSLLLALGFVMASAQWWLGLLVAALLMGVYVPVMREEERYLNAKFGAEFKTYAAQVPRFLPQLRGAPPPPRSAYAFELYLRHREYHALLGFVALVVYLWVVFHWGPLLTHL